MSTGPWRGTFDAPSAAHLWRRGGFGASRATLEHSLEQGLEATLAELFQAREHDPALVRGVLPLLSLESLEPLQNWWMALMLGNRAPLVERLALMWHDHFATSFDKVGDVRLMHAQLRLLQERGLGDFRELLHGIARDPAMLLWLDGNRNRKGQPNENFAREVMELFALGIGHYTERDVQEAARALTGWGVDGRRFVFRASQHDEGTKEVLGRRGRFDGEQLIDLVLAQPACPRHVAQRLLQEFVHPSPEKSEIDDWAAVLVAEEWSIARTLARLLGSELFFSPAARRARIAGPVELVAMTAITLEASVAPSVAVEATQNMGQALCRPPSVKGWDGGRTWIHTGSWLARHNFMTGLAYGEAGLELEAPLGDAREPEEIVERARALLLPDLRDPHIEAALLEATRAAPSVEEARRRATALVLTSPEYHLV